MLFSAPDEVARTNATTCRPERDERVGEVGPHEAVGARDQARPVAKRVSQLAP